LQSANEGAVFGTVGGAAAPAVGRAVEGAFDISKKAISGGLRKVGKKLVEKRAKQLNLIKDLEPDQALDRVAERLSKDYSDAKSFKAAMDEALLDEKAIANVGKEQTIALADSASLFPSGRQKAAETIYKQVADAPEKLKSDLSKAISNETNFTDALETMVSRGRSEARGLYEEAFKSNQAMQSPIITRILRTPAGNKALKEAQKNIQNSAATMTTLDDVTNANKILKGVDDVIEGIANDNVNVSFSLEVLDQVKRGFDGVIDTAMRSDPSEAKRLIELKRALVGQVDSLDTTGKYLQARRVSGDYLSNKAAMEEGIKFLRNDAENVINQFKNFGKAERESYRVGVIKSLKDQIEKTQDGRNVANFFNKKANRKKLRAILKPDEYRKVAKEAEAADNLFKLKNRVLGGSQTAERMIASEAFDNESLQIVKDLTATASPTQAALGFMGRQIKRQFTGLSDKKAEEVARILFTRDPSMKEAYVRQLTDRFAQSGKSLEQLSRESSDQAMLELKAFFTYADLIRNLKLQTNPLSTSLGTIRAITPEPQKPLVNEVDESSLGRDLRGSNTPKQNQKTTGFKNVIDDIFQEEGGFVADDGNTGSPAKFGINQKANPDIDVKNLTKEKAEKLYKTRYWNKIKADSLSPDMQVAAMDSAVNQGVNWTNKALKKANGNLDKFIELRRKRYKNTARNPRKREFLDAWLNRLDRVSQKAREARG